MGASNGILAILEISKLMILLIVTTSILLNSSTIESMAELPAYRKILLAKSIKLRMLSGRAGIVFMN